MYYPRDPHVVRANTTLTLPLHSLSLYAAMVDVLTSWKISSFVALFLQSILYGIYIITCGNCAVALTTVNGRWKSVRETQWPLLLAGAFLLLNATCSVCIQFYRCLVLLVFRGPFQPINWMTTVEVCCMPSYVM